MTSTLTQNFNVKNKTAAHSAEAGIKEFLNWNFTAPAGMVKFTAWDMVKYLKSILDDKTQFGKAAVITEKIYYKDEKREMGLATNISTDDQNTIYLKSGDSMGQSSNICYNRAKHWGFVLLLNQWNSKMRQNLLNAIYETVLK